MARFCSILLAILIAAQPAAAVAASSCCCINHTPAPSTSCTTQLDPTASTSATPACCALRFPTQTHPAQSDPGDTNPSEPAPDTTPPASCDCPASCCTTILKTTLDVPASPAVLAADLRAATHHVGNTAAPMSTTLQGLKRPPRAARAA